MHDESALEELVSEIRSHYQYLFALSGFDGSLDFEIIISKFPNISVSISNVFANKMGLFCCDQCALLE